VSCSLKMAAQMSNRQKKMAQQAAQLEAEQQGPVQYQQMPRKQFFLTTPTRVEPVIAKWITLWPNYINAQKSKKEGRRVTEAQGCDEPFVQDISEVCRHFALDNVIEAYARYPRDWICYAPGRVRVKLKDDETGLPVNPEVPTKKALMIKLGELIPALASRKERIAHMAEQLRLQAAQAAAASPVKAAAAGGAKGKTAGGSKKKGKKGRR